MIYLRAGLAASGQAIRPVDGTAAAMPVRLPHTEILLQRITEASVIAMNEA